MSNKVNFETYIRVTLQMMAARFPRQSGLIYRGPFDFVLQHGKFYYPGQPPPQRPEFLCFANAITMCVLAGWKYIEGYALDPHGRVRLHAWNAGENDELLDTTWVNLGKCYLGVEFSVERADDCSWNGDACVLDDCKRGWPLLHERWRGEPPGLAWPPSERLEMIKRAHSKDPDQQRTAHEWMEKQKEIYGLVGKGDA